MDDLLFPRMAYHLAELHLPAIGNMADPMLLGFDDPEPVKGIAYCRMGAASEDADLPGGELFHLIFLK